MISFSDEELLNFFIPTIDVPISLTCSYVAAVLEGHVSPLFPYISWTGMLPPESCIFSFMLNIGSALSKSTCSKPFRYLLPLIFLVFVVIFIRYKLLRLISNFRMPKHLNSLTFYMGAISCLGINLVANFQESNVLVVHMIGAFSTFGFATVYCCIQVRKEGREMLKSFHKIGESYISVQEFVNPKLNQLVSFKS